LTRRANESGPMAKAARVGKGVYSTPINPDRASRSRRSLPGQRAGRARCRNPRTTAPDRDPCSVASRRGEIARYEPYGRSGRVWMMSCSCGDDLGARRFERKGGIGFHSHFAPCPAGKFGQPFGFELGFQCGVNPQFYQRAMSFGALGNP